MDKLIKVLYVEDEDAIRDEMQEILELDVDELLTAANGQEGLELYIQHKPQIIISDVQMPVMDGLEMCEAIKRLDSSAKIILTTAFNEKNYIERAKQIGVDHYVSKPVNIKELFEQLDACKASVEAER